MMTVTQGHRAPSERSWDLRADIEELDLSHFAVAQKAITAQQVRCRAAATAIADEKRCMPHATIRIPCVRLISSVPLLSLHSLAFRRYHNITCVSTFFNCRRRRSNESRSLSSSVCRRSSRRSSKAVVRRLLGSSSNNNSKPPFSLR